MRQAAFTVAKSKAPHVHQEENHRGSALRRAMEPTGQEVESTKVDRVPS